MDIMTLDTTTFLPKDPVEGYTSCIWTERYAPAGEFVITAADIRQIMNKLPARTLISHLQTEEVMIVETHTIKRDKNNVPQLEVRGRTYETFLEKREYGSWEISQNITRPVHMELNAILVNSLTTNLNGGDVPNKIPNLSIAPFTPSDGSSFNQKPENFRIKDAYTYLMELLNKTVWGIRNRRSIDGGLSIGFYEGTNRSLEQGNSPDATDYIQPVIFRVDTGDIVNPSYLFNDRENYNEAAITYTIDNWPDRLAIGPFKSGYERRVIGVDGDNLLPNQDGSEPIFEHMRMAKVFDGEISPRLAKLYKSAYDLGDLVSIIGEYGFESRMQVTEFVRSEDKTGERAFPTLVAI